MEEINWTQEDMLEITLNEPDDFLKVRETLSRIGVASRKEKKLYQSCHILHKQGRYYVLHFKELFALDGKNTNRKKFKPGMTCKVTYPGDGARAKKVACNSK